MNNKPFCSECGCVHGPGNTNSLCPLASNYRAPVQTPRKAAAMTTKTPPVPDRRLTESDWLVIQAARKLIAWRGHSSECGYVEEVRDAVELWNDDQEFRESQEADERRMQRTGDTRT